MPSTETIRFTATFEPQAWQRDQAVPVDPRGDTQWDCTAFAAAHRDYLDGLAVDRGFDLTNPRDVDSLSAFGLVDNDDVFADDPAAPEWVRNWDGPFTLRLHTVAA